MTIQKDKIKIEDKIEEIYEKRQKAQELEANACVMKKVRNHQNYF